MHGAGGLGAVRTACHLVLSRSKTPLLLTSRHSSLATCMAPKCCSGCACIWQDDDHITHTHTHTHAHTHTHTHTLTGGSFRFVFSNTHTHTETHTHTHTATHTHTHAQAQAHTRAHAHAQAHAHIHTHTHGPYAAHTAPTLPRLPSGTRAVPPSGQLCSRPWRQAASPWLRTPVSRSSVWELQSGWSGDRSTRSNRGVEAADSAARVCVAAIMYNKRQRGQCDGGGGEAKGLLSAVVG